MKWTPSPNLIAQTAHVLAGAVFVFGLQALWPGYWWLGFLALLAFAAIKEFIFDALFEGQPARNNWIDFGFYLLGATAAVILGAIF